MSDADLKREIIETRNQMIKVDNHVTNLGLDIKSVEKRFDTLERRVRVAGIGVHAIVAVVIAAAAFAVTRAQSSALAGTLEELEAEVVRTKAEAQARNDSLRSRVSEFERARQDNERATATASEIVAAVESGKDAEAVSKLVGFDSSALSEFERRLFEQRVADTRKRNAESAYKNGRRSFEGGRLEGAATELDKSIALDPNGRFSDPARYSLLSAKWRLGKHNDLGPLVDALLKSQKDRGLIDEINFMHATSLAHLGKVDEAKPALEKLGRTRYATQAKAYLAAIAAGGELPPIPSAR